MQRVVERLRLGMCLSRCSLRVKDLPQYAQKTMVAGGVLVVVDDDDDANRLFMYDGRFDWGMR